VQNFKLSAADHINTALDFGQLYFDHMEVGTDQAVDKREILIDDVEVQ